MAIKHIVSFAYKSEVSTRDREEVFRRFKALQSECKSQDGTPYILDLQAGDKNVSPEGAGKGFDHIFIVTFAEPQHVKWYLERDVAHLDFVKWVGQYVADVFIYDFET